jgi:hypothetical protein
MAYSFQLLNTNGVPILDDTTKVMYNHYTENAVSFAEATTEFNNLISAGLTAANIWSSSPNAYLLQASLTGGNYYSSISEWSSFQIAGTPTRGVVYPKFHSNKTEGMIFWDFPTYQTYRNMSCAVWDFPDLELQKGIQASAYAYSAPEVRLCSYDLPSYSVTENYAMRIWDSSSNLIFDSRYVSPGVRHAVKISKATAQNILTTGTPLTITLPESMPNAWLCCPLLANFLVTGGNTQYDLSITHSSDDTVTVSRVTTTGSGMTNLSYYHDIFLFFMRN